MGQHSVLSASSSHRWTNCTASVLLTKDMPDASSSYAEEGSRAHELCAYKLAQLTGKSMDMTKFNYDNATEDYADNYASFVAERVTPHSIVFIEQRVDYSEWSAPGSFGTADCIVIDDNALKIIDYKHGVGVPVSSDHNPQLMLYALGAYGTFKDLYDINCVEMSIFQPRISNTSSFEMSIEDLLKEGENFKTKAKEALSGGVFKCGEWCRFCKAKNSCRVRADRQLAEVREDFGLPPLLSDEEVAQLLPKLDAIIDWCSDLKEYALNSALKGTHFDGYKLVYGRSVRRYTDEAKVAEVVKAQGLDPYTHKVLGITDMTKLLGKAKFEELLGGLICKPQGKPTLVPESDKRPAMANIDFDVITGD